MGNSALSSDQCLICFEQSGQGDTVLLFVHGWMGNKRWWDNQRDFFSKKYQIIQMDMGGHGDSSKSRTQWTAENYANDIKAVIRKIKSNKIIVIGHSMSGAYATIAISEFSNVKGLILVDTLKDLDHLMPIEIMNQIFEGYRKDYKNAVMNIMPNYLFGKNTPANVRSQLQNEFLLSSGEVAVKLLEPLYKIDVRDYAKKVSVPVRAINTDIMPVNIENNKKYFKDYACFMLEGFGHYPMLECPNRFNQLLQTCLDQL